MAKRRGKQSEAGGQDATSEQAPSAVEERMLDFAEDLGRLLGTAERKANEWLNQRQEAVKTLTNLRDTANQLLERLQTGATEAVKRRRGRRAAAKSTDAETATASGTVKRKRNWKMSAAQKKAVGDRMKKYWAARRRAEGR